MIAIPAIDLRDGCCVQLVGGSFDDERVRLPDPVAVAQGWIDAGFRSIHVVDLDAAMGLAPNTSPVRRLARLPDIAVQVGGGVRSTELAESLLENGARAIVVGTRAVSDPSWLVEIAERWPGRVIVAADARDGQVVMKGWTESDARTVEELITELNPLPLGGFLVTAVEREGRMEGPAVDLIANARDVSRRPVIASGGIGSMDDLRALEAAGASAAVIGMALYSGALDPHAVAREFAA
jgi:phosphoribosylformimino-5-aminoimidazole carboxamide ribotide isomerase